MRDRCAIVGIGSTEYSRDAGRSILQLALEASVAAVSDAGLTTADIDGLIRYDLDTVWEQDIANALGLSEVSYWGVASYGGASPGAMVAQAIGAIVSGQAKNVLCYRALRGRTGGQRYGGQRTKPAARRVGGRAPTGGGAVMTEYYLPYGLLAPGHVFALVADRHMTQFGTTSAQLGRIAVTCRERAANNPNAMLRDRPLSLDDYLDSPMLASPLRKADFCLETDGAAAFIVSSAESAADGPQPAVLIRAVAQA